MIDVVSDGALVVTCSDLPSALRAVAALLDDDDQAATITIDRWWISRDLVRGCVVITQRDEGGRHHG